MGKIFGETFTVRENPFIKVFWGNSMDDTYRERLFIPNMDMIEIQKEM